MSGTQAHEITQFKKNIYLCWAILLASGIIYGSSFSFMKIAVSSGAKPIGLVFWFAIMATAVLAVIWPFKSKIQVFEFHHLTFCIPWGILSVIFPNLFFFYAAQEISSGIIALGIGLVPLLTLAGAIALDRESLTARRLAGLVLGATAVMMILLPKTSLPDPGDAIFVLIAFAGAACYAAEHLYIEVRWPADVGVDSLLLLMFACVSAMLLPVVWATGTFVVPQWPFGAAEWAMIAVAGVTLLDYFLITLLILWAGPVFTSQAAYIVTLAGVIWGILIFQVTHTVWIWAALVLLMLGVSFVRPQKHAA